MDVEFRLIADHKERLLLELGQAVVRSGFSLLRQRLADSSDGVVLTMLIRGPEDRMLALEEMLATHRRVRSFEALARQEGEFANGSASTLTPTTNHAVNGVSARAAPISAVPVADTPFNPRRVEAVLPALAQEYPNIFARLLALERDLSNGHRAAALRYVGGRVGAWVYKRDFALGGKLSIDDSIHHIALPAVRQLLHAETSDKGLRVKGSPFCSHASHAPSCHFLEGFFEGLLNEAGNLGRVRVQESYCRATGSDSCLFEFRV